jgi:hypothetical protein
MPSRTGARRAGAWLKPTTLEMHADILTDRDIALWRTFVFNNFLRQRTVAYPLVSPMRRGTQHPQIIGPAPSRLPQP